MKNFYQHHNVHILSHLVKMNSKTVHIKENHVWDCLKLHKYQIRGKNHHRLHVLVMDVKFSMFLNTNRVTHLLKAVVFFNMR